MTKIALEKKLELLRDELNIAQAKITLVIALINIVLEKNKDVKNAHT